MTTEDVLMELEHASLVRIEIRDRRGDESLSIELRAGGIQRMAQELRRFLEIERAARR